MNNVRETDMFVKNLAVGIIGTNCYIVGSDKSPDGMVIDPGDEPVFILKTIQEAKLNIKLIVITHGHFDHTGALLDVQQATGATVAIHTDDASNLDGNIKIGLLLKGGEMLDVGGMRFAVIHTPGHSPGGICLYGEGSLFCGDTLFNYSVGRTDFTGGSESQLLHSIITKLMILPDNTIVYPGHEGQTTIGEERKHNPFLRFK